MADCFLGEIRIFAGDYAPEGWLLCQGQSLSVSEYQALYSVIGNTYGGDSVKFNLPNLMGRVPIGQGTGTGLTARTLGQSDGFATVTLTDATMPSHNHTFNVTTATATTVDPTNAMYASFPSSFPATMPRGLYTATTSGPGVKRQDFDATMVEIAQGGAGDHVNVMPTMVINYIIAMQGAYPQPT